MLVGRSFGTEAQAQARQRRANGRREVGDLEAVMGGQEAFGHRTINEPGELFGSVPSDCPLPGPLDRFEIDVVEAELCES